jgi:cyclophilin family peptidyl-prolyl cis-trans isomerase
MLERTGWGASRRGRMDSKVTRSRKLVFDPLEGRALMAAALAPIASITAPAALGYQVPLNGTGGGASQTYTVTSTNPDVKATIAQGEFLTLNITHTSSGAGDPSFSGPLTFQLFSDMAPTTVSRIEQLANSGFYNGKSFFRITDLVGQGVNFIAQAGAVNVTSTGGGQDQPPAPGQPGGLPATGFPFQNEFSQQLAFTNPGQLAMANAGFSPSDISNGDFFTNTSQFFVTQNATRALDFGYTIFAQLVADPNGILPQIFAVPVQGSTGTAPTEPKSPVTITTASLSTTNPNGVVHVDTTAATAGETSNVSVTAFDPATNTTANQSFTVTVGATNPSPGPTQKPFLNVHPPVDAAIETPLNTPTSFQVQGISAGFPSDPLTYAVAGGTASTSAGGLAFVPIPSTEGTATVSANGLVTVTPAAGFSGPITVLVGVRDQTDRSPAKLGVTDVSNYDVKQYTILVGAANPPTAQPVSVSTLVNTPAQVQLLGVGNNGATSVLAYAIATQPKNGTLSNFNPSTGTATYTPTPGFVGADTFTYTTTDTSVTPNLTSTPGTVTITVSPSTAVTGAVRLIQNTANGTSVLVITPPPNKRRHQDQIAVSETFGPNPVIQVEVNGVLDSTQPAASTINEIVIYGSKTGTSTVVAPNVDVPLAGLDTGHGGTNFLNYAGSGNTSINSWFGHSAVQGGSATNAIVGRKNHLLKVVKSPGTDSVFLSEVDPYHRVPHWKASSFHGKKANLGAFYKFVGNRLVKTNQPVSAPLKPNGG